VNAGVFLADAGNIGTVTCAAIDTAAVISYAIRARGGTHGAWWRTPVGLHLMVFIAAFAIVLDQAALFLLATDQVLVSAAPIRPDWSTWLRVASFCLLIPPVLAWRLYLILRPPRRPA
jgi:hypothetical protein